jgi:hypothetical protein
VAGAGAGAGAGGVAGGSAGVGAGAVAGSGAGSGGVSCAAALGEAAISASAVKIVAVIEIRMVQKSIWKLRPIEKSMPAVYEVLRMLPLT